MLVLGLGQWLLVFRWSLVGASITKEGQSGGGTRGIGDSNPSFHLFRLLTSLTPFENNKPVTLPVNKGTEVMCKAKVPRPLDQRILGFPFLALQLGRRTSLIRLKEAAEAGTLTQRAAAGWAATH